MAPTSDERREVAGTLRQMTEKHSAVEASRVVHALGLEYEVHRTVVAFGSDAVQALADLIDPTCKVSSVETYDDELGQLEGWEFHLTCGHSFQRPWNEPPAYCPECGARVVERGDS